MRETSKTNKHVLTSAQSKLRKRALAARKHAHAPQSNFFVGAALEAVGGKIYTGCNIECDSAVCCAERVALFKAIADGATKFRRIAVVGSGADACSPCGICRQAIVEFADDMEVIMSNMRGKVKVVRLKDLLPLPYHLRR